MDFSLLKQILTSDIKTSINNRNTEREKDIQNFLRDSVINKFCSLCGIFNIDPLNPLSLPVILLLMCKSKTSLSVCCKFLKIISSSESRCIEIDSRFWKSNHDGRLNDTDNCIQDEFAFEQCNETFSFISDWTNWLDYVTISLSKEQIDFLSQNKTINRLRESMTEVGLTLNGIVEIEHCMLALIYMSPRSTPVAKMMERFCVRVGMDFPDLELRCNDHH